MGKNHRHSKKLKSEKNKIHIKSKTKFLPKGQNVTNTAFKIKPIVLQEQLKEREQSSLATKKKANIDELVSKLKHFNDTVKTESCQDLKEIITSNPVDTLQIYLSSIIQNCSALIQDREKKVRRASVKLLHTLFEKTPDNTLRPFFGFILTNLKCAMTNISKNIQEDSLLLLDAILDNRSLLIAENFNVFFPNFLLLISKLKNQSTERSLSLNLEGKVTSVKWRVKVLARLYGVLHALIDSRPKNQSESEGFTVSAEGAVFVPIYSENFYERIDSGLFSQNSVQDDFDGHILSLTQLLYEIWMEIVPEKNAKRGLSGTVLLTEESVAVFVAVVNILKLLQEYIQGSVYEETLRNKALPFLDSLMSNFPYSHNKKCFEISKDFPKYFSMNHDQNCVEENLIIVYIYVTLRVRHKSGPKINTVSGYLKSCLTSHFRLTSINFPFLVKTLKEITQHPFLCRKIGVNESELMENMYEFCSNEKIPEKFKDDILEILINSKVAKSQPYMSKLPSFFCQKRVSAKLIDGILDLCRKDNEVVQNGVRSFLKRILENLPTLEIRDAPDLEKSRKDLASIFFYLPSLNEDEIEEMKVIVNGDSIFSRHLADVLDLRCYMLK